MFWIRKLQVHYQQNLLDREITQSKYYVITESFYNCQWAWNGESQNSNQQLMEIKWKTQKENRMVRYEQNEAIYEVTFLETSNNVDIVCFLSLDSSTAGHSILAHSFPIIDPPLLRLFSVSIFSCFLLPHVPSISPLSFATGLMTSVILFYCERHYFETWCSDWFPAHWIILNCSEVFLVKAIVSNLYVDTANMELSYAWRSSPIWFSLAILMLRPRYILVYIL